MSEVMYVHFTILVIIQTLKLIGYSEPKLHKLQKRKTNKTNESAMTENLDHINAASYYDGC